MQLSNARTQVASSFALGDWLHVRRLAPAVLLSVLFVCMADSSARASCGDYVTIHGATESPIGRRASHATNFDPTLPEMPLAPRCDGPACCGQNPLPAPPPSAPNRWTNGPHDIATMLADVHGAVDSSDHRVPPDDALPTDGHRRRLARPPR